MFYDLAPLISFPSTIYLTLIVSLFVGLWTSLCTKESRVQRSRLSKLAKCLPGPPTIPLVGNALSLVGKPGQLLKRILSIILPYEDVTPMRVWIGTALYIVVTSPSDLEVLLNSNQATHKGIIYKFLFPFIGDGLISGSGKLWRSHRKMILPTLNPRKIRGYVDIFERRSRIMVEKLKSFADGRIFDIREILDGCTIDVVSEAVMGCDDINAQENLDQEFIQSIVDMYKIINDRMVKIWLYDDWIFNMTQHYRRQCKSQKIIRHFVNKCIRSKQESLSDANKSLDLEKISILERLLVTNNVTHELTHEQLSHEIFTLFIAAQDTLALQCSFASLMLAMHPKVQEKARSEIKKILTRNERISLEDLSSMRYLEMCIKETMRLFPIAPFLIRSVKEEVALEKCTLPKGCQVVIASYVTHRSAKYWKNPDKFIPERFSIEESSDRHPYAFIPFSGGPMRCIGQNFALLALKTILANLLLNYKITTNVKMQELRLEIHISVRSADGYKVSLEPLQ